MAPTNRNNLASSSSPQAQNINNSTPCWRCGGHHRLHRDAEDCTDSPPTSPIPDTPGSFTRWSNKRAGILGDSQLTEPTPSRPAGSRLRPQGRAASVASPATGRSAIAPIDLRGSQWLQPDASIPPSPVVRIPRLASNASRAGTHRGSTTGSYLANNHAVLPQSEAEQIEGLQLSFEADNLPRVPSNSPTRRSLSRIPETPQNPGTHIPSSPPLPSSVHHHLSTSPAPPSLQATITTSPSPTPTLPPTPTPTTPTSILKAIIDRQESRANRLHTRSQVNLAQHQASERKLSVARQQLSAAENRERDQAVRGERWAVLATALAVLLVGYAVWCEYWSAEREFIYVRRRAWLGLLE